MIRVFLDSSVILAGVHSLTGASHIILQLVQQKKITAFISSSIVKEVGRNLKKKFPPQTSQRFIKYIAENNIKNVRLTEADVFNLQQVIEAKDVHVVAGAIKARVDYLVTLDKKHLLSLARKDFLFRIVTPGELLQVIIE